MRWLKEYATCPTRSHFWQMTSTFRSGAGKEHFNGTVFFSYFCVVCITYYVINQWLYHNIPTIKFSFWIFIALKQSPHPANFCSDCLSQLEFVWVIFESQRDWLRVIDAFFESTRVCLSYIFESHRNWLGVNDAYLPACRFVKFGWSCGTLLLFNLQVQKYSFCQISVIQMNKNSDNLKLWNCTIQQHSEISTKKITN